MPVANKIEWPVGQTPEARTAALLQCLHGVVDQVLEEGRARQGEYEGLFAYAVLARLHANAQAWGVPLEALGLENFEPDSLLAPRKEAVSA